MADYIPAADADFDNFAQSFSVYVTTNLIPLGLVAGDVTDVTAALGTWSAAFPANNTAQVAAQSARQAKDDARATYETAIRALVRQLQASPEVDDAERQAMGITVRDTTRTAAAQPATRPLLIVDTSQRLQHIIAFVDEATPTKKAKPEGVMGVEIWVKIGDPPPIDPSELSFVAVDTRTPYTTDYTGADAKKTAHYMARWTNTKGEKGPWSETASATIGA